MEQERLKKEIEIARIQTGTIARITWIHPRYSVGAPIDSLFTVAVVNSKQIILTPSNIFVFRQKPKDVRLLNRTSSNLT